MGEYSEKTYLERRYEQAIEHASKATDPRVGRAHMQLAQLYWSQLDALQCRERAESIGLSGDIHPAHPNSPGMRQEQTPPGLELFGIRPLQSRTKTATR